MLFKKMEFLLNLKQLKEKWNKSEEIYFFRN